MRDKKINKSNKNPMAALILKGHAGVYGTNCVLARALRTMIYEYGITYPQWTVMVQKYVNRISVAKNVKQSSSECGNIHSQISRDHLTWKTWLKVLAIFGFDGFDVKFSLKKKGVVVKELEFTVKDLMFDIGLYEEDSKDKN